MAGKGRGNDVLMSDILDNIPHIVKYIGHMYVAPIPSRVTWWEVAAEMKKPAEAGF
jgi:hypothetical protein